MRPVVERGVSGAGSGEGLTQVTAVPARSSRCGSKES